MSKIIDNKLFLGDLFDANDEKQIQEKNINCIVCVAEDVTIRLENQNIKIYQYNLQDTHCFNISLYFDEITDIIDRENIVLVNCAAGISRSSTIVIAYLMKYHGLNLRDALIGVKDKRNIICPNKNFLKYLFEYEKKVFGKNHSLLEDILKLCYYG